MVDSIYQRVRLAASFENPCAYCSLMDAVIHWIENPMEHDRRDWHKSCAAVIPMLWTVLSRNINTGSFGTCYRLRVIGLRRKMYSRKHGSTSWNGGINIAPSGSLKSGCSALPGIW